MDPHVHDVLVGTTPAAKDGLRSIIGEALIVMEEMHLAGDRDASCVQVASMMRLTDLWRALSGWGASEADGTA